MSTGALRGVRDRSLTARLPSTTELRLGLHDTQLLVRLRWRLVRSRWSRLGMLLSLATAGAVLVLVANTGALVRFLAEDGRTTAASTFAVNYVVALDRGDIGGLVATTLGAAVLTSFLAPFSGSSVQALADVEDLAGIRPSRMHRYFDSVLTSAVSSIGFLQLVALTAVASLLTLDGDRSAPLAFTWASWPVLVLLTTAQGWTLDLAHRSLTRTTRRALACVLLVVLLAALWLDPRHGATLFGAGEAFAAVLRAASRGDWLPVAWGCLAIVLAALLLTTAGMVSCRAALARPVAAPAVRERTSIVPMSRLATVAVLQVLLAHVWRTPQVRRPILTMLAVGLPVCALAGKDSTGMSVVVVAAPLSVALAFGVNVFGVLGPGMIWLAAQPRVLRRLLATVMVFQVLVTLGLAAATWVPAVYLGAGDLGDAATLGSGLLVSTAICTASSVASAVHDPHAANLRTRNDMVVPPVTAIRHTLRLALVAGQPGVLALHLDGPARALLVLGAITWLAVRAGSVLQEWQDPAVRAFVASRVAT